MKSMSSTIDQTSEERVLEILVDQAPVGVCIIQDGRFRYANYYFLATTEYMLDELMDKDSFEIVVPEDREMVRENTIRMLKSEVLSPYQFRVICRDGRTIWVMATVRSIQYHGRQAVLGNYMEITGRKQLEDELKENEARYRELADSITDVFFAMDEDLRYTYWNKASELLTGIRAEDAMGKSLLEIFPDSPGLRKAEKIYRAVLRTHKPRTFTNDFDIHGKHYIFEISAYPSRVGISVFVRDITERKREGEALRRSEERYRTILEEMEDAYFEVDLGGHFTFINNSTCRDLGYSREELMGMSYKIITVPEHIESVFQVFNDVYETGLSNKGFPWRTVRKDGSHGFAETSVSPILDDNGEIAGFRGVGRDITERKRIEEALQQSEEKYRALFDSTVIGTVVIDSETMKLVMANQAAVAMLGFSSAKEVVGVNPLEFVPPEDRDRVLGLIQKEFFEQGLQRAHELRMIAKDGREIWISANGAKIMHEGRLMGLACFTDITDKKQQNERLLMTDRLASLGELASGAAHEINNPLTSIIGFSELLMEKEVPDDVREQLKLINSEARRAVIVTNNFLSFARKHSSTKELNQINDIIEDVLELRAHEHKVNHIDVTKHFDTNLPEVMVDYFQMQQVFMNIIINAEYFMVETHNAGTLLITTEKANSTVRISFADDGPGITAENIGRIFDPFFTTKEAGSGTGLGLSICHGIVNEHGGQIYATSQLGKGTTIVVELPIKKRAHVKSLV
ncbi:MAG: PAS domain S-box protein [Chloroflexota bacterium]|nr:MAG: PAS domain S-box protein [Chloroflexota bacterium]